MCQWQNRSQDLLLEAVEFEIRIPGRTLQNILNFSVNPSRAKQFEGRGCASSFSLRLFSFCGTPVSLLMMWATFSKAGSPSGSSSSTRDPNSPRSSGWTVLLLPMGPCYRSASILRCGSGSLSSSSSLATGFSRPLMSDIYSAGIL